MSFKKLLRMLMRGSIPILFFSSGADYVLWVKTGYMIPCITMAWMALGLGALFVGLEMVFREEV